MVMRMGSQRLSSSSPKPSAGRRSRSRSNCSSSSPSLTPPGAPGTLGPVPRQAMARAAGSSGGGCSSKHPQFARGRRWPRSFPAPDRESGKAPRATRGQRPPLQKLYENVRGIRRLEPGQRDRLLGSWLQAAIPEPGAGRVRLFRRSPPALYSALLSPPQRSAALEVRRAGAGRGGTDNVIVQ